MEQDKCPYKYRITVRSEGCIRQSRWTKGYEQDLTEWINLLEKIKELNYLQVEGVYFNPDKIIYVKIEVKQKKYGIWWRVK